MRKKLLSTIALFHLNSSELNGCKATQFALAVTDQNAVSGHSAHKSWQWIQSRLLWHGEKRSLSKRPVLIGRRHGELIRLIATQFSYRTVGVVNRLAARSVTCDNAQLSEPCSCWPAAASVSSGH